jgi:hypothetical protein
MPTDQFFVKTPYGYLLRISHTLEKNIYEYPDGLFLEEKIPDQEPIATHNANIIYLYENEILY